jgi:dienelactone hydrolase
MNRPHASLGLPAVLLVACAGAPPVARGPLPPAETPPEQAVVTPSPPPPAVSQDAASLARAFVEKVVAGDWDGVVATFDDTMRGALPKEKLAATWDAIVKRVGAFKSIDDIEVKPHDRLRIAVVKATFEHAPLVLRVVLDAQGRVAGFFIAPGDTASSWQPPSYANAGSFEERRVTIGDSPPLPGTWTTPKDAKAYPAVVLVHGSGPNDEDETIGALKVFKDLACGLASRGVAVLRYDKRTRVDPSGVRTQKDEAEDAAHAAVAFVAAQPDVDKRRVVLVGHSQGGYLAPRIAKSDPAIRGVVTLAGSTRPLQDSLVAQLRYIETLQPAEPKVQEAIAAAEHFKEEVESPTLRPDDPVELPLGSASAVTGAYFLDVRDYRPAKVASELSIPILVLQGERDYQVTVADDFSGWKTALARKKSATLKTYPALNHAFCAGSGPSTPEDYLKPGHVDEEVVVDIAAWVTKLRRD